MEDVQLKTLSLSSLILSFNQPTNIIFSLVYCIFSQIQRLNCSTNGSAVNVQFKISHYACFQQSLVALDSCNIVVFYLFYFSFLTCFLSFWHICDVAHPIGYIAHSSSVTFGCFKMCEIKDQYQGLSQILDTVKVNKLYPAALYLAQLLKYNISLQYKTF